MKKALQNDTFFSILGNLKFWRFGWSFSDVKFYKHMETDKFLGTMLLDLSGTYFVFINYSILFLYWPLQIFFCIGDPKILPSFETCLIDLSGLTSNY